MRRNLVIALLAVLALTLSAPAAWALDTAEPRAGERISTNAVSNWWNLLREWWANGLPETRNQPSEAGPDGASVELGPGADPDGSHRELGPGADPDGLQCECGPGADPNGGPSERGPGLDPTG